MINGDDTIINHESIKEPAAELGRPMKTLTVLSPVYRRDAGTQGRGSVAPRN